MERAEARCRCKPSGGFHRRPGRSRKPMGAQPDTSTSAPEVWHGVLEILAPIFVPRLLATYLGFAVAVVQGAVAQQNPVTAIDIALEPDATMVQHAMAANARLLKALPKGFALDKTH